MKLIDKQEYVEVDGSLGHKEFGIMFNAKMAYILSDSLYGNKIRAVIRELSTNAYDSHVDAGHNKPIEVSLPTTFNPKFSIRDFGTGMSHEKVIEVYCNYGASDKEDSDSFTGCLGLGSKTPFCYHTRTATVEVYYNGEHRIYTLFRNEDSMPCCDLLSKSDTDEPNGVKITLPVSHSDTYTFEREAVDIYQYFKVKPNFVGSKQPTIDAVTYVYEGKNWGYHGKYEESNIIMGNVAYPLDVKNLGITDANDPRYHVANQGFDIFVNIGDVNFQPSREGLDYNTVTKVRVLRYLDAIVNEVSQKVEEKIKNSTSLWNARCNFNVSRKELKQLNNIVSNNCKWQNQPLGLLINGKLTIEDTLKTLNNTYVYMIEFCDYRKKYKCKAIQRDIFPENKIVVNDLKVGIVSRTQELARTLRSNVYYVSSDDPAQLETLLKHLGCDKNDVILASSLPKPVSNRSYNGSGVGKLSQVVEFNINEQSDKVSRYWKDSSVDLDEGGVYVEFDRYTVNSGLHFVGNEHLGIAIRRLRDVFGIKIPVIYGVRKRDIEELDGDWVSVYDWIKEQYENIVNKYNIDINQINSYQSEINHAVNFRFNTNNYYGLNLEHLQKLDSPSITAIKKDYEFATKEVKNLDKVNALTYISDMLGLKSKAGQVIKKLNLVDQLKNIGSKYPMLGMVSSNQYNKSVVQDYINLVEKGS